MVQEGQTGIISLSEELSKLWKKIETEGEREGEM